MKYITTTLFVFLTFNSFAQSGQEQFEKCYNELKNAKSLFLNGAFRGFGKNDGKVVKTEGTIALQKDGFNITRYKSLAISEIALLEKIHVEQVSYDGVDVYSYNEDKGEFENKGHWDPLGKNYSGYSKILYNNLSITFDEFKNNKENISMANNENGYVLKLPSTQDRGQLIMDFNTGSLSPKEVIRYNEKDNDIDYVSLTLTNVRYNVSFPLTFFETGNSSLTKPSSLNSTTTQSLLDKRGNSTLLVNGVKAPDWELLSSDGVQKRLSDFKGKVVVLDFWATWCAPCIQAQPLLQSIHEKYKDVIVLGMDFNDRPGVNINDYKEKRKLIMK